MKKIAIPIYNDLLSEHFGTCSQYAIFTLSNANLNRSCLHLPQHISLEYIPKWISDQGITDLITYRIDKKLLTLFVKFKIDLYVGVKINSPEIIIEDYMRGTLQSDKEIINELTI